MTTTAPDDDLAALSAGAVDMLDVAARLEASGVSDRTVRTRHHRPDVFSLALTLHRGWDGSAPGSPTTRAPSGLAEACRRGLLLVAGVLLAAMVLEPVDLPASAVWVTGMAGWIGGQAVSAIAWTRVGLGQHVAAVRRAGGASLLTVVVAVPLPLLAVPDLPPLPVVALTLTWVSYACAVSLLVCADRSRLALPVVAVGVTAVQACHLAEREWSQTAAVVAALLAVGAVVLAAGHAVHRADGPALPDRADWRAAAPAVLQAALLAVSLLMLVLTVAERDAAALVVASVVGAAMADPAVAVLKARLRASAGRLHVLTVAARHARRAALLAAAATAGVSAAAAVAVVLALRAGTPDWPATVVAAAAFTALATTSAALTAFGAPWRAVLAGAAALAYALAALLSGQQVAGMVFALALLFAIRLLLRRVSDPRVIA